MTTHILKTWPEPFEAIRAGLKPFEVRKKDRDYKVGDILHLKEWSEEGGYTGRWMIVNVTYIFDISPFVGGEFIAMTVYGGLPSPVHPKGAPKEHEFVAINEAFMACKWCGKVERYFPALVNALVDSTAESNP